MQNDSYEMMQAQMMANSYRKNEQFKKMFGLLCEIAVFSKDKDYAAQAEDLVKQIKS